MSAKLRPDFLNLERCARSFLNTLSGMPHELRDTFGNVIANHGPAEDLSAALDLQLRSQTVASLRLPSEQGALVKGLAEQSLESELSLMDRESELETAGLLAADLDQLLLLSETATPIEEVMRQLLRLLRAHLWVERASVFSMLDGFTLEGLTAIGWPDESWKVLYSTAVGAVASSRQPYAAEDPKGDKHLSGRPGVESLRNLFCFPLVHGQAMVGVLTVSNRLGGAFTEDAKHILRRFAGFAAHLLQKHFFKTRMGEVERTNDHLGKYLSQKVVKDVENTQELMLGGTEKKVVCLFSDIRGYTTITEGISAATLVKLLNFHFERMHAIIEKNEGTLDKIVGDLIMAVWNIPKDQPDPELLAMRAALEMQKEMIRTVMPEWQRHGVEKVGMGVGVNAGRALAGNLGSTRFMNYTVIGDAVNTAQRLEAKARSGEIWMNEEMYPLVHGKLEKPIRRELEIRLKGKEQTINALVYRPLAY